MTVRIRVTPEAEAQAKAAKRWWRANRRLAPAMFRQELAGAFQLLRDAPEVGSLYHGISDIPSVRRLALLQTRYHIYYVYDARADIVHRPRRLEYVAREPTPAPSHLSRLLSTSVCRDGPPNKPLGAGRAKRGGTAANRQPASSIVRKESR